jgi:uncharacterized protein (UPF0332 family)
VLKLGREYLSEIKDAEEFLKTAEYSLNISLKSSANRLYFALERAVVAYLHFKGRKASKNRQKLWGVALELLGENYYQLLMQLYDLRLQADYGTISKITSLNSDILRELIVKVKENISFIKKSILIHKNERQGNEQSEKGGDTKEVL